MARRISDEEIRLNIIINGNEAQKEILDLEKANIGLKDAVKDLTKQQNSIKGQYDKATRSLENQRKEVNRLSDEFKAWEVKGNAAEKELKRIELQSGKNTEEYKRQEQAVKALTKEGERLWNAQDKAATRMIKLSDGSKGLRTEFEGLTKQIKTKSGQIEINNTRLDTLRSELSLTEMTTGQLKSKASLLSATLAHLVPGTEDYEKYNGELNEIKERLAELKGGGEEASFSLGSMADKFNRYAGIIASFIAGLTGIVLSIQKVIDFNKKLADSISDVQKTTGMSKMEVEDLIKTFGKLHTRTSKMELLGIAEIGGKLGIAKEEIADFVRVMDKSAVALGDAFEGGPEVVAEKLGRIKGLYEELRNSGVEAAFESVGSALNDLGAAGTASEQNVSEFVQRVGSMPDAMKPAIQEALGLGAAFEESGLKAELAGNNYSKVISIAARDTDRFAKVMRRPQQEIKNLINSNPTEFFLQFSNSLKGLDATELSRVLDYLKLNDNEVKMVIGAASQNVEMFRDKIKLAGESMAEATSLTDEFNIKNNNLAATLERLQKKVMGWFTSDSVVAFITSAVDKLAKFVGAIEDSEGSMTTLRNGIVLTAKLLSILVVGMISYTTTAKLVALWSNTTTNAILYSNLAIKAHNLLLSLQKAALVSYVTVLRLFGLTSEYATARLVVLNRVAAINPWGAMLAVIGALITAYAVFSDKMDKAARQQKIINQVALSAAIEVKKEKDILEQRLKIARDNNLSDEQRMKAMKEIIAMNPEMLKGLTLQNIATEEGQKILDKYIYSLEKAARAKAVANKISELYSKLLEIEQSSLQDNIKWHERLWNAAKSGGVNSSSQATLDIQTALENKETSKKEIQEVIDRLVKEQAISEVNNPTLDQSATSGNAWVPTGDEKEGERAAAKARKLRYDAMMKSLEDAKKVHEDSTELERKAIDERLALMQDGFDKEEAIEAENHRRKLQDLQKQLISEEEFAKLQEKINDATLSPQERGAYNHIKQEWANKNEHINTLIELEEGRHQLALETISTKAETKRLTDLQADFDREAMLRKAAHNEELAALGNNERAKERLEREFNKAEIERQRDFLQEIIDEKQKILQDKNNQVDVSLLTPEQLTQLENDIAKLKLEISELAKAKAELTNKNGSDDFNTAAKNVFGNTDVLGFTADQWGQTFNNIDTLQGKMAAATMVVGALKNAWGTYNDYLSATEDNQLAKYERGLDTRKKRLKSQLDNGYINQVQYQRELAVLDAETEKKRAEIEYKQAKRQKAISIANIILNTAQAIMGIWAQFPKYDFGATASIMSGVVGALGAIQLATVVKTPLPAKGYEKGLYPEYVKREQDGKTFRAGYGGNTRSGMVNKPTYFLAGENGPEMVIDAAAYRQMSPSTKNLLIRELRGIKGFEQGYYNNDVKGGGRVEVPASNSPVQSSNTREDILMQVLQENTAILQKIHNEGVTAYYNKDPRDLKKMMEDMDRVTQSRDKAKN